MKRFLFYIFLVIVFSVIAEGGETAGIGSYETYDSDTNDDVRASIIKIIGGLTSSNNNFEDFDNESRLSLTGGIGIETGVNKSRFCAEVLFSYENVLIEANGISGNYRFVKLTMPVLYKHKFRPFTFPYIVIGGAGTIIFADAQKESGTTNALFDISLVIGVGLEIDLFDIKRAEKNSGYRSTAISIEGRYQMGMNHLDLDGFKFSTSSLYILVGIRF